MKITPELIASLIGGSVEGCRDCAITGIAKIEEAKEGDVSFIANPKYAPYAATTAATALIVSDAFEAPEGCRASLIRVADPYSALAKLMAIYAQGVAQRKTGIEQPSHVSDSATIGKDVYIGAFAYIGDGAMIADGTMIYPHAYIGDNVELGPNCTIRPGVTIYEGTKIGANCTIHSGSVIGSDGFGFAPEGDGYRKIPQIGIVVIEDDVEIGANTTIDRATMGETRIGKGTKLDNLIQVAHNVRIGRNNVFAAQTGIAGSAQIGDSNRVGGQVGFAGHIKFGNGCEVGAQSGIHKNYGDNNRIIGYPAVPGAEFARLQVLLKRLPDLYKDVELLKKKNKE